MGDQPATKQDLAELRNEVLGAVQASEDRLREFVRDVETNLLKAFYGFAESDSQRHALSEGQQANLLKRMNVLEERVLAVEKRLNMPPAA